MVLKRLIHTLLVIIPCLYLVNGNELRQDRTEQPFSLRCRDGEHVSLFAASYFQYGNDHRRYRIQCQKLQGAGQVKCRQSNETDLVKYFDAVGCSGDEYLAGFESTRFQDGDRKFRLICCRASGLTVLESRCRSAETSTRQNFTVKVLDDEVIHKVSSKFSLWQRDRRFVVDRRWTLNICKIGDSASNPTTERTTEASTTGGADSEKEPPSVIEICKTSVSEDGFSVNEPAESPGNTPPERPTPAFKTFRTYCPNGHAIKSIRIVAKVDLDSRKTDTAFSIHCEKLPLDDDITTCPVRRKELAFREDNDFREMSSQQSPCDASLGQFLCGLSGLYHNNRRRLSATCCTIKGVLPSASVEPVLEDPEDRGFAEVKSKSKNEFVINLDQLPGGAYVGHMASFQTVYEQKGKIVPTASGCQCKCPCKCQVEEISGSQPPQQHRASTGISHRQKNPSADTIRERRSKTACGFECTCKCILPCDK